jgi:flavin reductase (DIM6/NTAB) family NADH-FMN oxidoreductase RutF
VVASHNVIFGVVEAVKLGPEGPALVYHGRVYKRV